MAKSKTPSFIVTLNLNPEIYQKHLLDQRFEIGRKVYNQVLSHANKQLQLLLESKRYRALLAEYRAAKKGNKKAISDQLSALRFEFGLSEYQLHAFVRPIQKHYKKHIDSHTSQKIASTAWESISAVLFKKGKRVHFKKYGQLESLENKSNGSGMNYENNTFEWVGLTLRAAPRKSDQWLHEALTHRVKYCRIMRRIIRGRVVYQLQLIMEGYPPAKRTPDGTFMHEQGTGRVGIDIGVSTVAIVAESGVSLRVLGAPTTKAEDKLIKCLKHKLDRSRRQTNPGNYNLDGTIKRGVKLNWIRSNRYTKTLMALKEAARLRATHLKMSHNQLANEVVALGNEAFVEKMNFAGLKKRVKKTTKNKKTGKFNSKKRFGKSINNNAPAMLVEIIKRKLGYQKQILQKINTKTFKASQYNHVTDRCTKKKLSQRWNYINGLPIQRDLYSAFLIMNSEPLLQYSDRNLCMATYDNFRTLHGYEITRLKTQENLPGSMGIKKAS